MKLSIYDSSNLAPLQEPNISVSLDIFEAEIVMPRVGVWQAYITSSISNNINDIIGNIGGANNKFIIQSADQIGFNAKCSAYRIDTFINTLRVKLLGGNGGLETIIDPKAFNGCTIRTLLNDILNACGENPVDSNSDDDILDRGVPVWVLVGSQTGKAYIQQILDYVGATTWRFNPILGTFVCLKKEPWPVDKTIYITESYNVEDGFATMSYVKDETAPTIMPGTMITVSNGSEDLLRKVSYVVHTLKSNPSTIKSRVYFQDEEDQDEI
jgi:hypothetical protein